MGGLHSHTPGNRRCRDFDQGHPGSSGRVMSAGCTSAGATPSTENDFSVLGLIMWSS